MSTIKSTGTENLSSQSEEQAIQAKNDSNLSFEFFIENKADQIGRVAKQEMINLIDVLF